MNGALIHAALRCAKGTLRVHNGDACYFCGSCPPIAQLDLDRAAREDLIPGDLLFAVSSGVDLDGSGALAAYTAMSGMHSLQPLRRGSFTDAAVPWLMDMNARLVQSPAMGGCTAAAVYVNKRAVNVLGLGDSRIYRLHEGRMACLTHDHTKMQMLLDVGLIDTAQVPHHPQRDLVTRYLGMDTLTWEKARACICRSMPLMHGDRYLLCTDGVSDLLSPEVIGHLLHSGASADDCADRIMAALSDCGRPDDVCLIVLETDIPSRTPPGSGGLSPTHFAPFEYH